MRRKLELRRRKMIFEIVWMSFVAVLLALLLLGIFIGLILLLR